MIQNIKYISIYKYTAEGGGQGAEGWGREQKMDSGYGSPRRGPGGGAGLR